jgi:hypothetical protein
VEFAFLSDCQNDGGDIPENTHLLIIRQPSHENLDSLIDAAIQAAGRHLHIQIVTWDELRNRLSTGDQSIVSALNGPKVFVLGREDRFVTMLGRHEFCSALAAQERIP